MKPLGLTIKNNFKSVNISIYERSEAVRSEEHTFLN